MGLITIGAALAQLGADARDNEDLIIVDKTDGMRHRVVSSEVAAETLEANTYVATGRFRSGTVTVHKGRGEGNVASIWTLAIDSDLKDKIDRKPYELTTKELDAALAAHLKEIVALVKATKLAPNLIACTGYGFSLWYLLEDTDQGRVEEARALNKRLVAVLNLAAGRKLADPQVSDAGTRIMRIPGSDNTKDDARTRRSVIMHEDGGRWALDDLQAAVDAATHQPEVITVAPPEKPALIDLPAESANDIVREVAPYWTDGQRHDLALGLVGWLRRAGVAQWQAGSIVGRLVAQSGGDAKDLRAVVRTTYSGDRIAGHSKVKEILPDSSVRRIDDLLSAFWRASQRTVNTSPVVVFGNNTQERRGDTGESADLEFEPLPDVVLQGATAEYLDIVRHCTEAPEQFHVGAFLAVNGALAGRVAFTTYASKRLYANQYVILVGATGTSKKDTAINFALNKFGLLERTISSNVIVPLRFAHLEDAGSDVALLKALKEQPNALLVIREMAQAIAKMRSKGREALFDLMLTLWDANGKYENRTIANPVEVYNPTLSLIAGIQPERLRTAMNDQVLSSGFMNRPLIIPGEGVTPISNPPSVNTDKSKELLKEILWRYDDMATINGNQPVELPMSADSAERWDAYYKEQWWAAKRSPDLAETASRNPDLVRKIALHYAITELGRTLPERLEWRHIEAGMALVDWKSKATAKLIGEWGGTDETRIETRIKTTLERRGPQTVRTLKQNTYLKGVPSSVWHRAFDSLRKTGDIVETATAGVFAIAGEKEAA